jgi:hypothetical protein
LGAKCGHRVDAQLRHDFGAPSLGRAFRDPQFMGDLLIELADDDTVEDLSFSGGD